ncbi:MAG: hypothetical protein ACI8RD_000077 [Bacillariaceae sp.]|jgi:hypothetical protein
MVDTMRTKKGFKMKKRHTKIRRGKEAERYQFSMDDDKLNKSKSGI